MGWSAMFPKHVWPWIGVAAALLVLGAVPYVPYQIDDAWIVFAYAWRFVENGDVAWSSGERVEGFSSWLHLALMIVGAGLRLDLSVVAKLVSVAATCAALAAVVRPASGSGRGAVLVALACWQPLHFWSTQQLETMLAAAIAAWAWPGVMAGGRTWSWSILGLTAFAVTRPEGAGWLAVALLARTVERRQPGVPDVAAAACLLAFVGFHIGRTAYFGEFWSTPYMVKVADMHTVGDGVAATALQLASAGVILGLVIANRTNIPTLVWAPLAIQVLVLARANGDWMGNARFLVPGVFAAVTAGLQTGTLIAPGFRRPVLMFLLPATFLWEPDPIGVPSAALRDIGALLHPIRSLARPWPYPLFDEVERIVQRVPEGGAVELSDVGAPGNVPGIRVLDTMGLVDGAVAYRHVQSSYGNVLARFDPDFSLACVRYDFDPLEGEAPDLGPLSAFQTVPHTDDVRGVRWRCRTDELVAPSVQAARWSAMLHRYPSQGWLRWAAAHTLLQTGDEAAALAVAGEWNGENTSFYLFDRTTGGYEAERGWGIVSASVLVTAAVPPALWSGLELMLDADDPGEEGAIAELSWLGACSEGPSLRCAVRGPTPLALPACSEPGDRALSVRFVNDRYEPGAFDRNLWVRLASVR